MLLGLLTIVRYGCDRSEPISDRLKRGARPAAYIGGGERLSGWWLWSPRTLCKQ